MEGIKGRVFFLIACAIILVVTSSLTECSTFRNSCISQEKDEEEKSRVTFTPKLTQSLERRFGSKISLDFIFDLTKYIEKSPPLPFSLPPLKIKIMGMNTFFGGPVNRFPGDPLLNSLLIPVYSLHRDPVTGKFWWD